MKIPESLKTEESQRNFEAALVVVLLIVIPAVGHYTGGKYGGGIAMVLAGALALIAYLRLFGARLRSRCTLRIIILSAVVGAIAALVIALLT